ncbi:early lactation protein [Sitodiplosis mosellana]|uniref:early lactation protein n=1 Tax=Sitodiplosis mosellana TaxID=263140 RepID=UPI0024443434|nr:early lactation protein [Sitodiplosis mosellana]
MQATKVNVLLIGATVIFVFALINEIDAKPLDIYDEIVDNDEKQLLIRMAELIESIGADDSERFASINNSDSNSSSASNELKDMKPGERCILPVRKGVCRALIPRWSYDPSTRECSQFKFGGCDGNGNNFSTRKQCMDMCRGI